jgi:hypothetical protein
MAMPGSAPLLPFPGAGSPGELVDDVLEVLDGVLSLTLWREGVGEVHHMIVKCP